MKCTYLIVFLFGLFLPSISSRHVQFYRKDYTYIEEFDAFYKVHWDLNGVSWDTAFFTCDDEGASLFYPKAKGEWALVKNLTDKMSEVPNVTKIFVGLHDEFKLGEFITVDGHSTPYPLLGDELHVPVGDDDCVLMDIDTGLYNVESCNRLKDTPLPFVCKKQTEESCPTIDKDYKYEKYLRKCFKVNKKAKMWQEAMQTCFMEGGILAVIENSAQANAIQDMTTSGQTYFVGVRRMFPHSDYYTVTGEKFSDMYQLPVSDQSYDCGCVYKEDSQNLYTNTQECGTRLPFICQMEATV